MRPDKGSITRRDFVEKFVATGLRYEQAGKVFDAMTEVFSSAIISGQRINVGKVLAISPVKKEPRQVCNNLNGLKTIIFLGARVVFRVKVFKEFLARHDLKWDL